MKIEEKKQPHFKDFIVQYRYSRFAGSGGVGLGHDCT